MDSKPASRRRLCSNCGGTGQAQVLDHDALVTTGCKRCHGEGEYLQPKARTLTAISRFVGGSILLNSRETLSSGRYLFRVEVYCFEDDANGVRSALFRWGQQKGWMFSCIHYTSITRGGFRQVFALAEPMHPSVLTTNYKGAARRFGVTRRASHTFLSTVNV